ncbi:MAG: A-macroglobulin complement component [Planctomycetes bacterium]|nr:A-macroglobulin complement component [Planctomycetota bacterium]
MNRRYLPLFALPLVAGFVWTAISAEKPPGGTGTPETPGGVASQYSDRYLTYVSTDKPIYRPGETLYVRSIPLHGLTRCPVPAGQDLPALVEIKGPKGDSVAAGVSHRQDAVHGFSWAIPRAQAGGEYTIKVSYPYTGQPSAERKFDIRAYRAPRLKTQIKFIRDGYGAGDEVVATLHADRAEGGVPANSAVTVIARVDGTEVYRGSTKIDQQGNCLARFKLPNEIRRGEGTLALVIEDGGVVETASKTIPILLQTVDLTMYPEGGDLVAGLVNRVYFEAFTPTHKPADLAGVVLDADGAEVATFRSQHEGRGRFTLTPVAGHNYTLKITEPFGIKSQFPLPATKSTGVILGSLHDVTAKGEDVKLSIAATEAGVYRVVLQQREQQVSMEQVELTPGGTKELTFSPGAADGVLRATVLNAAGNPLAERLVFRQPEHSVQVQISADAQRYVPGSPAKVTVKTCDETGIPISTVVGITATDESVLEMIDRREQAPRLPVMVLLESEVKELADAHVYLDPANEKAPVAVDLLLGTQGWRRFAFVDATSFVEANGDAARRVLALREFIPLQTPGFGGGTPMPVMARPSSRSKKAGAFAAPAELADGAAQMPVAEQAQIQAGGVAGFAKDAKAKQDARPDGARRALAQFADEARMMPPVRNDFVAVRVYAHQIRSQRKPDDRTDFTETLFWSGGTRTNERGEATVEFGLNDSVTSFRITADAFSDNGALGAASLSIESVAPFYLEPKLPLEVTMGDLIRLPLGIVNATNQELGNASLKYQVILGSEVASGSTAFGLSANGRIRRSIDLKIGRQIGESTVLLDATAGPYTDQVTRTMQVRPLGFPTPVGFGGLLAAGGTATHDVSIPQSVVPGSLETRVVVYPSPLASMNESLAALIREPCGCFEQTSSTVYPLVMSQQYFLSHQGVHPSLIERSSLILQTGYDRLRGFESPSGGFEWFGGDPGHDALTAYGLMEFTDMAQVRQVDPVLLERTRTWLLNQRDSHGGYLRKTHTLHSWIADPECANTYNTWALLEAGVKAELSTEVQWVRDAGEKSLNTYAVALAANVLALAGDKDGENHLLDKLLGKQQPNGSLSGATTSVIGSGGEALAIETTALAALAWMRNPSYAANVESSIKFLAESCKAGRFGSTQSTILALRAIVAYDKSRAQPTAPGSLQLVVDGKPVGQPVAFDRQTTGAIELPGFAERLTPGKHQIQVLMQDGSRMPYSVAINYHSVKPNSSDNCKLHLEVNLRDRRVEEGAATEATVVVVNRTNEAIPTPIAIIGIPGGLEVRHDQLKELVKQGKISAYEVIGREVVLYWRSLDKEARVDLPLSLIAAIPGTYTGPASRAYLYYTDEYKQWADGLTVEIHPMGL